MLCDRRCPSNTRPHPAPEDIFMVRFVHPTATHTDSKETRLSFSLLKCKVSSMESRYFYVSFSFRCEFISKANSTENWSQKLLPNFIHCREIEVADPLQFAQGEFQALVIPFHASESDCGVLVHIHHKCLTNSDQTGTAESIGTTSPFQCKFPTTSRDVPEDFEGKCLN
ncbi:hypothetical protein M427DRAFT_288702 [Gonapodya prolifera JEL478]|uniref:Uncharacterized protein n=1 Tax=Gonapodya prolifera (strain JEL478) TaxID=1344416 RepID=A0A139AIK1_GONPJ|nr:hypothetical protein M427DRAFT_288702 [Gonapodya prolifera JEL478]|eukprot:KXS16636.1 hypothetical protein M427DRAFT_288702 [Gonapodya prolifera JEL478]